MQLKKLINLSMVSSSEEFRNKELKKLEFLKGIVAYINSYEWLTRSDVVAKVKAVLASNYDYDMVAKAFKTTKASLKVTMSNASKSIQEKIGANTIQLVLDDDLVTAELQYKFGVGLVSSDDILIDGVRDLFKNSIDTKNEKVNIVSLLDCNKELGFLVNYSKAKLLSDLSKVDINKMLYIFELLESTSNKHSDEKKYLFSLITGQINGLEFKKAIENLTIYN